MVSILSKAVTLVFPLAKYLTGIWGFPVWLKGKGFPFSNLHLNKAK